MTIDKDTWSKIEKELYVFFGKVTFKLEGEVIIISKEKISENKLGLIVYINGEICLGWASPKSDLYRPITEQLWRRRTKRYYTEKDVKEIHKIWGKRRAKKEFPELNDVMSWREPYFLTAKSLIAQYKKIVGLELVSIGYQQSEDVNNG